MFDIGEIGGTTLRMMVVLIIPAEAEAEFEVEADMLRLKLRPRKVIPNLLALPRSWRGMVYWSPYDEEMIDMLLNVEPQDASHTLQHQK